MTITKKMADAIKNSIISFHDNKKTITDNNYYLIGYVSKTEQDKALFDYISEDDYKSTSTNYLDVIVDDTISQKADFIKPNEDGLLVFVQGVRSLYNFQIDTTILESLKDDENKKDKINIKAYILLYHQI